MSNREICYSIIDGFTEEQLASIAALLTSAKTLADDAADEAYCARLLADYQKDEDKGEPVELGRFAAGLGIEL